MLGLRASAHSASKTYSGSALSCDHHMTGPTNQVELVGLGLEVLFCSLYEDYDIRKCSYGILEQ